MYARTIHTSKSFYILRGVVMEEEWRDIKGYEGIYQVSNLGRVKSLSHLVVRCNNSNYITKERILRPGVKKDKRMMVVLCVRGVKKSVSIHRLVAQAFIPNPDNLPEINHKDENPQNNTVTNLEWCTGYYNKHYGTALERMRNSLKGRKQSLEEIAKRSNALRGHKAYNKGVPMPEEQKKKISVTLRKYYQQKRIQVNN